MVRRLDELCPKSSLFRQDYRIDKIHYSFCWFGILKVLCILSRFRLFGQSRSISFQSGLLRMPIRLLSNVWLMACVLVCSLPVYTQTAAADKPPIVDAQLRQTLVENII